MTLSMTARNFVLGLLHMQPIKRPHSLTLRQIDRRAVTVAVPLPPGGWAILSSNGAGTAEPLSRTKAIWPYS